MLVALMLFGWYALPVGAQEADPTEIPVTSSPELESDVQAVLAEAEEILDEAQGAVDLAFNMLGIFEMVGVLITVVGLAVGAVGFARLLSAESSLNKAREAVEKELAEIRQKFEADLAQREERFQELRANLENREKEQRHNIANANLAIALLTFGERQYRAADLKGALDTYQRALALDDNNPVTYYRIGYVHINLGQLDEAATALQRSLQIDDRFDPAKVALGYVHRRQGEKLTGIERERLLNRGEQFMLDGLSESPKLVDDDGESWWGALGGLYRRRGQAERAIHAYKQASTVTPYSSYPFGNLATLYGEQGDVELMVHSYEQVERLARSEVQAQTGNYWGLFDLLTAQLVLGHSEAAEATLPIALEMVPADADYALDSLLATLRKIHPMLADRPHAEEMLRFCEKIEAHARQRQLKRAQAEA